MDYKLITGAWREMKCCMTEDVCSECFANVQIKPVLACLFHRCPSSEILPPSCTDLQSKATLSTCPLCLACSQEPPPSTLLRKWDSCLWWSGSSWPGLISLQKRRWWSGAAVCIRGNSLANQVWQAFPPLFSSTYFFMSAALLPCLCNTSAKMGHATPWPLQAEA